MSYDAFRVIFWRMRANEALAKIPVVQTVKPRDGLNWKRKTSQFGTILALILIPLLGIFRIDVSSGFIVLDRQIWFADFHIVFGFWLAIASSFIIVYSTVGTAFCGWACPQNTFSSLADSLTSKLLGKRAAINWEKTGTAKIAHHKNKTFNWMLLGIELFLASLVAAIIPLLYFIPPIDAWRFFTFQDVSENAFAVRWIYFVLVFIVFVNLTVIRHYVCRYMCIYRMWQFLFKTRETLHINYDESRSSECEKCNYCQTQCMVDIDPRNTNTFDSCTNCGACITACNDIHAKKPTSGLLSYKFGARRNKVKSDSLIKLATSRERVLWVFPVWLLGVALFAWGLWSYDEYHMSAYKSEISHGNHVQEYRVNIASKVFEPGKVTLHVEGLKDSEFSLSASEIDFSSVERKDVLIQLREGLAPGVYPLIIRATSDKGWQDFVRVNHVVTRG